jgi:hypothetical protein
MVKKNALIKIKRLHFSHALTFIFLTSALVSFCALFAHSEVNLNLPKTGAVQSGVNLCTSDALFLQINIRYNQLTLIEGLKNRKAISSFNSHQTAGYGFSFTHHQLFNGFSEYTSICQGNPKVIYLFLDLPPPQVS